MAASLTNPALATFDGPLEQVGCGGGTATGRDGLRPIFAVLDGNGRRCTHSGAANQPSAEKSLKAAKRAKPAKPKTG